MARKSRKSNISVDPAVSTGQNASTAIYVRLSVENSGKNDDGDSIEQVKSKFVCKLLLGTCGAKGCLASLS